MNALPEFVIVGGGLAAGKAAEALRTQGFTGRIILVGDENHRPYLRPPLSKDYLQGKADRDSVLVHPDDWYDEHDVELLLGNEAIALDRTERRVRLSDGSDVAYDRLLLATGSSPRLLSIPGADLTGVHYLRRIEDCEAIKAAFGQVSRVVIVGAGWIGLETAAAARAAGLEVTVLESADLPLVQILGAQVGKVFADLHTEHGVDLRLGVQVESFSGNDGLVTTVHLKDGTSIATGMVIVGVGITPNVALAESAGIEVDNGIVVDEHLRTSDPDVFAAGDVANAYNPRLGRRIRVEHWANAVNQPAVAAAGMLGRDEVYDRLPYFYSDQYDLGMEYTGYADPDSYDEVVFRGDVKARTFIAFWLAEGRVLAGMNVNIWDVTDDIKALIESGRSVDLVRLADTSIPLADL